MRVLRSALDGERRSHLWWLLWGTDPNGSERSAVHGGNADDEWDGRAVAQLKSGTIKGCPVTRDIETGRLIVELGAAWKGKTIASKRVDFAV